MRIGFSLRFPFSPIEFVIHLSYVDFHGKNVTSQCRHQMKFSDIICLTGTQEHFPMQHINTTLITHAHGSARVPSVPNFHGLDEIEVKCQVHCIEKEAYLDVLRAFGAQSDFISWDKEGVITELRKELNVTDAEHRELLVKIDSDESVRMIRDWRKVGPEVQESYSFKMNIPGCIPSSVGKAPHKKLKTSHAAAPTFQNYSHGEPYSAAIPAIPSPLPAECRFNQQSGSLVMLSTGNARKSISKIHASSFRKGNEQVKSQSKKSSQTPDVGNISERSGLIQIRTTDKLLCEVERMIPSRGYPDPVQLEKATLILREHERSILDSLAKLSDILDGDYSPNQVRHHY